MFVLLDDALKYPNLIVANGLGCVVRGFFDKSNNIFQPGLMFSLKIFVQESHAGIYRFIRTTHRQDWLIKTYRAVWFLMSLYWPTLMRNICPESCLWFFGYLIDMHFMWLYLMKRHPFVLNERQTFLLSSFGPADSLRIFLGTLLWRFTHFIIDDSDTR